MKKLIPILLLSVLVVSTLSGCSGDKSQTNVQEDSKDSEKQKEALVNNTYKTGYPIVKDKITLKAVAQGSNIIGMAEDMEYFKELEKLTNIHIEFEQHQQSAAEKINLMFASRDFPDIIFRGANDMLVMSAGAAGDIIPLNDLLKEYAPNWTRIFKEMPYAKKVTTMPDGKIYSLPSIYDEDVSKSFRDIWLINVQWLNELNLKVPTTTEEYRQVLRAFKENAGRGSIPKNVIPWYFRYGAYVGGPFDIFGSFGVLVPDGDYMIVKNGKVQYQAINHEIKKPINYLHELYKEKLISDEAFTDDFNVYSTKVNSKEPIAGAIHSYGNPDLTEKIYQAIKPIKAPGIDKPIYRQQTNRVERNYFSIFTSNKYPEATIRLIDTIADKDWSIQGRLGMYGKDIEKTKDGKIKSLPVNEADKDYRGKQIPKTLICTAMTGDIFANYIYDEFPSTLIRLRALEMYKPYIAPLESFYPPVVYTSEQVDKKAALATDIKGYVSETIAHWIVDGGIDAEWDSYVKKINQMGLEEYLKIYQDALDAFNKN